MLTLLPSKLSVCVSVYVCPLTCISSSRRLRLLQFPSFVLKCTPSCYFYACYLVIYHFVSDALVFVCHLFSFRRAWSLRRCLSELLRRASSLRIICLVLRGATRCPVPAELEACAAVWLNSSAELAACVSYAWWLALSMRLCPFQVLTVSQGSRVTDLVYLFL